MIWASRKRRGPDPYLDWKVRIFFAGALLAFIGMASDRSWVVGLAIGVLVVGLVLNFLAKRDGDTDTGQPDDEEGAGTG